MQVAGSDAAGERLYEWNQLVAGAWHETLGSFEIVLRNALDAQLLTYRQRVHNGNGDWYADPRMPWGPNTRLAQSIRKARGRATLNSTIPEVHGKVVAELTLDSGCRSISSSWSSSLITRESYTTPIPTTAVSGALCTGDTILRAPIRFGCGVFASR